jgi:hypothetical protein
VKGFLIEGCPPEEERLDSLLCTGPYNPNRLLGQVATARRTEATTPCQPPRPSHIIDVLSIVVALLAARNVCIALGFWRCRRGCCRPRLHILLLLGPTWQTMSLSQGSLGCIATRRSKEPKGHGAIGMGIAATQTPRIRTLAARVNCVCSCAVLAPSTRQSRQQLPSRFHHGHTWPILGVLESQQTTMRARSPWGLHSFRCCC